MAISLIAVVMAAVTTFFVNAVASTNTQRATQAATQVANSTMDTIRALPPSDLSALVKSIDPNALTGTGLPVPVPSLAVTQQLNNITYTATVTLGACVIGAGLVSNTSCASALVSTGIGYLRAVVTVTWAGARCPPANCTYATSTLLSTNDDPLFNLNQSAPPAPLIVNPGAQIVAVGDNVVLPVTVTAIPTFKVTITAGTLPSGLNLDTATGIITGVPLTVAGATSVTLTLTDGFGRAISASFTWTVLAAVTAVAPPAQASVIGSAITPLTVSATGGSVPYTWSAAALPPGLSLSTVNNQAVITGTPTAAGLPNNGQLPQTFSVVLTVKDAANRTATVPVPWTINYPPFAAANPGPQTSTVGIPDSVTLTVTGGSGSFSWASNGPLPAGLTLTAAGVLSGSPTAVGVTSVSLTVTDTKSAVSFNPTVFASQTMTFNWTVYAKPTVTSPGNQAVTTSLNVQLQLTTTCPNAPCTYVVNNGPATIAIDGNGLLTGTITSGAQTFNSVTVTVTDSAGAAVPSASFVVVVNAVPTIAGPGNLTNLFGTAVTLDASKLVSGGTAPFTYYATNLPPWLTLNASTGLITGTTPGTAGTTTGVVLGVRDVYGFTANSPAFSWTVGNAPSPPLTVTVVNGDATVAASWAAPASTNGAPVTGYTATANVGAGTGGPSCSTTGALTCSIGGLTNGIVYSVTVVATNSYGTGPASAAVTAIPYPAGVMSAGNGLTLWLDGADPTVLLASSACSAGAATSAVGCWKDKSGQATANNFSQTAGNLPGLSTWNGLPAVNFGDPSVVLNSVNANAQYQTVFVAANVTNPASGSGVIVDLFGKATQDFDVRVGTGTNRNAPNGNDWSYNTGSPALNWANGAQTAKANQPLAVVTSDQSSTVQTFAASVSNTFYSRGVIGQVGDVITFNKILTNTQRRAVEDYLSKKWGVTITAQALTTAQAPTAITGTRSSATSATVSWTAPGTDGVAPISGYTVKSSGGQTCTTAGTVTCTVTGLTTGTAYTFTVTATNSVGTGPSSVASNSVTP